MRFTCLAALAAIAVLSACSSDDVGSSLGANGAAGAAGSGSGLGGQYGGAGAGRTGPGSEQDLATNVGDRVFFTLNQSQLSQQATATLDHQAAWLNQYPANKVQIAGNCDERGTEEFNLVLGSRRANAAATYLQSRGISPTRMTTTSYGSSRPTALGSNEQAWAQNRNAITSLN